MHCLGVNFFLILLMNNPEQLAGLPDTRTLLELDGLLMEKNSKVGLNVCVSKMNVLGTLCWIVIFGGF